ncbi:MAG: anti-sigma factor [Rubrivivax sp.]|jgi:anti-sigma-K factor RskA|nr:anti-sigma factor [Rubrivivax sp.]
MDYARTPLADMLAAQYVAGTLRGGARRRFESLLPAHPALRRSVADWQARLLPLTGSLEPVAPPTTVWRRIEARLWPAPAATPALPWWQRLALWRGLSGAALAAFAAVLVWQAQPQPVLPPVVVVLQGTGADPGTAAPAGAMQQALFVASVSGDGAALTARPLAPVALSADRVFELWSVPPEGNPRSLGLISGSQPTVVRRDRLPQTLLKGGTAALAVSIEPPGGSPTGVPTGPVVFAGKLQL